MAKVSHPPNHSPVSWNPNERNSKVSTAVISKKTEYRQEKCTRLSSYSSCQPRRNFLGRIEIEEERKQGKCKKVEGQMDERMAEERKEESCLLNAKFRFSSSR